MPATARGGRPAALPILAVPVGERDVVRAAFVWNLAVEIARLGASATLIAPSPPEPSPIWPEAGPGPVGAEVVLTPADGLAQLHRAALDLAVARAADSADGGLVLVCVPPAWLGRPAMGARCCAGSCCSHRRNASTCSRPTASPSACSRRATRRGSASRSTAPAASRKRRARSCTSRGSPRATSAAISRATGCSSTISTSIALSCRGDRSDSSIPQSRAARALRDVARLLLEDARKTAIA